MASRLAVSSGANKTSGVPLKMGLQAHRAILVTSWDENALSTARAKAVEVLASAGFGCGSMVTPVVYGVVNGYGTFIIVPDGSKLGWPHAIAADNARENFLLWLRSQDYVDYAYVQYGGCGDGIPANLLASSDNWG